MQYNARTKTSCKGESRLQDFFGVQSHQTLVLRMKPHRCFLIIDGSNFYFKLKDLKLHRLLEFDFSSFAKTLIGSHRLVQCRYYVGAVRTGRSEKTKTMHANQQKLFAHLKKHHVSYALGYLLRYGDHYHEKGVDVEMAVDMLIAAYEDTADHFVVISSDTDLLPAIRKVREKGKIVEYVGFSHAPSLAMVANCSESRLLKAEDLQPFISKKKSP
jgi:uncharacterized LabA/DUF88 family protein